MSREDFKLNPLKDFVRSTKIHPLIQNISLDNAVLKTLNDIKYCTGWREFDLCVVAVFCGMNLKFNSSLKKKLFFCFHIWIGIEMIVKMGNVKIW